MGEESAANELLRVDLPVPAAADDVDRPDDRDAKDLPGERHHQPGQVEQVVPSVAVSGQDRLREEEEQDEHHREKPVPEAEHDVSQADEKAGRGTRGHLGAAGQRRATSPAKLYQRKNSCTCENPFSRRRARFSSSRYGIRTFSRASRFWEISISE